LLPHWQRTPAHPGEGPTRIFVFRGRNGFTCVTAHAFAFGGFDPGGHPPESLRRLHVERAITWWAPLIPLDWPGLAWRTEDTKGARRKLRANGIFRLRAPSCPSCLRGCVVDAFG